jgi:hypothetical protein
MFAAASQFMATTLTKEFKLSLYAPIAANKLGHY